MKGEVQPKDDKETATILRDCLRDHLKEIRIVLRAVLRKTPRNDGDSYENLFGELAEPLFGNLYSEKWRI